MKCYHTALASAGAVGLGRMLSALVVLGLGAGCDPGPDAGSTTPDAVSLADHPIMQRFPPTLLPWKAHEGALVGRKLTYEPPAPYPKAVEMQGMLAAIAAQGDRVAIVFPPEDREGFDVATGGLDAPWTRVHLIDTPVDQIGTLDAVGGPNGTLHVVFRGRDPQATLTYVVVSRDGEVTREIVARPSPVADHADISTCDDVAVGVTPAGDVDFVYQHYNKNIRPQVVVAHRAANTGFWTQDVALSPVVDPNGPYVGIAFWGCRNRLAYDEDWKPVVATLLASVQNGGWDYPVATLVTGADGRMYFGSTPLVVANRGPEYRPDFDVARSPAGFVVLGNNVTTSWSYLAPIFMHGVGGFASPHSRDGGGTWKEALPGGPIIPGRNGGKIMFTACYTPELWFANDGGPPNQTLRYGLPGCPYAGDLTPVGGYLGVVPPAAATVTDPPAVPPKVEAFTFTHGQDPFNAALCLFTDGTLNVCRGNQPDVHAHGYAGNGGPLIDPEDIVTIASSSIADGATDVPRDTQEVVITLKDAWPTDESAGVIGRQFFDNVMGADFFGKATLVADRATRTLTYTLPGGFAAGRTYLLPLPPVLESDVGWHPKFAFVRPQPALRFTVAGRFRADIWGPRDEPIQVLNCAPREEGDPCVIEVQAGDALAFDLHLSRPAELGPDGVSTLRGPDGVAIESLQLSPALYGQMSLITVSTDVIATPDTTWVLELGEVIDTAYGTRLSPEDRHILVHSDAGPPHLVTTEPADGATDVALDAALRLTFNVPMDYDSLVYGVTLRRVSDEAPVVINLLEEGATTFRLGHDPLEADTTYRVDVAASVRDTRGLRAVAPESVTFTTGATP